MNEPDKNDNICDWLWKMGTLFDQLSGTYAGLYNPYEHLFVGEIILIFKGRVIFRKYIPKKRKCFGVKVYKLCDMSGYT
jgi:hypothetical protein